MNPDAPLSDAEREVLNVLWDNGPITARRIRRALEDGGRDWAPTTVGTLLSRLEKKGYIDVDKSEFVHVFQARVSCESVVSQRLREVADAYCDGRTSPLVLALVENQSFSAEELRQFRELVDRLEREQSSKQKRKRQRGTKKRS